MKQRQQHDVSSDQRELTARFGRCFFFFWLLPESIVDQQELIVTACIKVGRIYAHTKRQVVDQVHLKRTDVAVAAE